WRAYRTHAQGLLLDGEGFFIDLNGAEKPSHCTCGFVIYADTQALLERAYNCVVATVGACRIVDPMFAVYWYFVTSQGLDFTVMNEVASDELLDEAYPDVAGGVGAFIGRYLESLDPVLVLQGPPGSGKTRLLRAILGELSRRRGEEIGVITSNDPRALVDDQLYVRFLTSSMDAFVIEDADNLLRPRSDGNELMQRFLTIADGIVRNRGRKIIFTTNLPNIGDLDDALVRPGRCFARLMTRTLRTVEAERFLTRICAQEGLPADTALGRLHRTARSTYSVAELYRLANERRDLEQASGRTPLALIG
ncbi:MAG: ATP-binding protein, partial [Proteobacteria bacterium]|nr:ATP-binding protein [Pseudomonadota bacterium]